MDWICSAYPLRRACDGEAEQTGLSRTRAHRVAGVGVARHRRAARSGDFGDRADQGLGADAAQEESAAAECGSDRAEGIRAGRRRRSRQETRTAEEGVRFLHRAAGNGSRDSGCGTLREGARRTTETAAGDGGRAEIPARRRTQPRRHHRPTPTRATFCSPVPTAIRRPPTKPRRKWPCSASSPKCRACRSTAKHGTALWSARMRTRATPKRRRRRSPTPASKPFR